MSEPVIGKKKAKKLDLYVAEAAELRVTAEPLFVIESAEQEAKAVAFLGVVKKKLKELDEARDYLVRPLKTKAKEIEKFFHGATDPLEAAEKAIKKAMTAFRESEDFKAAEAERERLEGLQKQRLSIPSNTLAQANAAAPKVVTTSSGQARFRDERKHEVIAADLVPRELCSPDPAKIKAAREAMSEEDVRAGDKIPGLKTWIEKVPSIYGV